MTEKEKALQLVEMHKQKMNDLLDCSYSYSAVENIDECAKQCALLCVNEIIEVIKDNCLEYDDDYWENVKKEIELL